MKDQPKRTPESLDAELKRIYADPDGTLPDFTRLEGKPSGKWKSIIIGGLTTLVVLGAVTWGGLLFFSRTSGFTGEGVELSIETNGDVTAGKDADLVIHYKNGERIPLASASIELKLPDGFKIVGSDPVSAQEGVWDVGSIPPNGSGDIKVRGYVRRELEAAMTFEAKLEYHPADFNSAFQKVASHTVVVNDSVLKLTGSGPEQMTPGDDVAFTYAYENTSDQPLENMRFIIDPIEGFILSSTKPAADEGVAMQWTLPKIDASASGTFVVKGTFSAASRGTKTLPARMGFAEEGGIIAIAKAEASTNVLKSNLDLSLIVNGSTTAPTVSFNDTLFFTLRYENAGDVTLKDVVISAALPSEPLNHSLIDWVSLKDDLAGKRSGSTLAWTKKEIPALTTLSPGDKGEINFSVQLVRKPFADAKMPNYVVHATASAAIGKAGNVSSSREVDAVPMDIRLLSDVAFQAYGRYFNDDGTPLGSGPLPPQVGQKTVYRIFWVVQNSLHELTNLSVTTLLPQGVKWTGVDREVQAGALTFDDSGRKATWRLNRLPTSVDSVLVSFDVELDPSAEDAGKILDLTGDSRLEALDKDVNAVILKTAPAVGTDLIGDENAAGKGVVRE